MKKFPFNTVAILGLGLIGGSLALDLKARRLCRRVVGYNRSAKGRAAAKRRKACDAVFARPEDAVVGADLVVLATPVRHIPKLARAIAPHLKAGAVVTDVGSTKEGLVKAVERALPRSAVFIGGHPIAGTEHSGMDAAEKNLFAGRWWILTPGKKNAKAAARLKALARGLGAKVAVLAPREHDRFLAAVSHLPHVAAFSLVDAVWGFQGGRAIRYAGGSFRDVTRVAASSPEMWTDIALENRTAILDLTARFQKSLSRLRALIARGDAAGLQAFFAAASRARKKL